MSIQWSASRQHPKVTKGRYALLWKQIYVKPEDDAWDTQTPDTEQIGNILETSASFLFLQKDTKSIKRCLY